MSSVADSVVDIIRGDVWQVEALRQLHQLKHPFVIFSQAVMLKFDEKALRPKPVRILPGCRNGCLPIMSQERLWNRALYATRQSNQSFGMLRQNTQRENRLPFRGIVPGDGDER